jgi:hypothetical protein
MAVFYLVVIVGVAVIVWLLVKKVALRWYEWLIGIVGYLLALLALQNWAASLKEVEPRAAWILLMMIGIPAVTLLVIAWLLPYVRLRRSE